MIAIVQRVSAAKVTIAGEIVGQIGRGMLVLATVEAADADAELLWTAQKIATLRIFQNADKAFDVDVKQIGGSILLVSNFTVAAETTKGRRPGFSAAAPPEQGRLMFDRFIDFVRAQELPVQTGRFGADMAVELVNDGPATFIVKSPAKNL